MEIMKEISSSITEKDRFAIVRRDCADLVSICLWDHHENCMVPQSITIRIPEDKFIFAVEKMGFERKSRK